MLTEIRDRSSGWFAWIIAALIIIPMAFWGVQEYASTEARPTLVEIGDQKITQNQFQAQLNNEQQRQRQAMGDRVNNDLLSSDFFKQNVLEKMVNRALIEQVATDQNYQIGNKQLESYIKGSEFFQVEGEFDEAAYERYIQSSQYSKTQFEQGLRDDNRVRQVTSGYQESALVLPDEVRALLELQAEQRSFDIVTVKQQDYAAGVTVSNDEIATYYSDNEQQFLEAEKVSVNYVELDINQIATEVEVDEEEIRAIYDENVESYTSEEKRQTRHILLSTSGGENDAEQRAKAEALVTELRAGGDFAKLATDNSNDPGSAAKGGDLGVIERGQMVPEFEEATFALDKDEVSDPVKSQFGYHIIQVQGIDEPKQQSFEDVKFNIEQEEKDRQAEELLLERVGRLRDMAFEQPDSLDAAAEELSTEVRKTDLFEKSTGLGLAATASVREAAFSEEVLVEGNNSEPIEVSEGRYVVLRKLDYQESRPQPLEKVSATIKQILSAQKANEAAAAAGESLLAKAQNKWSSLTEDKKLDIVSHTVSLIDTDRKVTPEVMQQVARLQLADGAPVVSSIVNRNGDFNILRLTKIEAGDINKISQQVKDSTRRLLEQRNGQSLVGSYIDTLREQYAPVIDNSLL